jgi:hypothetical protein
MPNGMDEDALVKWECACAMFRVARSALHHAAEQFAEFRGPYHAQELARCATYFEHRRRILRQACADRRAARKASHDQDSAA